MKYILKSCSYIFHPLFVSVYTSIYFFTVNIEYYNFKIIILLLAQITLLTVFIPIVLFYLLKYLNLLNTDIMINSVKERRLPLAIQMIYFFIIFIYTLKPVPNADLKYFFLGALLSTFLALIAAFLKHKVSLHMVGISGMATFIIAQSIKSGNPNLYVICTLILIMGFVASSRLFLKAHTLTELFWGTLIGIYCQIYLYKFWL